MSTIILKKKDLSSYLYTLFLIIIFNISAALIFVTSLHGQYKLNEDQTEQLRGARTVSIVFNKPGGSAAHVTFPVVDTIKKLFPPAGLSVVPSGGDMVFKINFNARANSRRYSRLGGGFAQTGYTGASVSGNVFLMVGEVQFLKKYFSGKEGTKSTIARGTYTKPTSAPFKKAFLKSSIRKTVMDILSMFNPDPIALLITYPDRGDWYTRKDAILMLESKKDPRVLDALHRLVTDKNDNVRLQLAKSLGRKYNSTSTGPLLTMLADKDSHVRKEVLKSLKKIDSKWQESSLAKQMVPTWISLLNHKHWSIQQGAIDALIEVYDESALKPMIKAMMSSYSVRGKVVKFLDKKKPGWKSGPEAMEAVDYFIRNLSADTRTKKQEAAKALGELGARRALVPIINQLKDPDKMVRASTLDVLEKKFPDWGKEPAAVELVPHFLKMLRSNNSDTRIGAINVLSNIDDPRVITALLGKLKDRSWRVKNRVIKALGNSGDPRVIKPLTGMLKVTSKSTKEAAVVALGKKQSPLVVEPLIGALKDKKYSSVRSKAATALGHIKDARAVEPLIAALNDANNAVKAAAARALGKQKDQRAMNPLMELTKSKLHRVRSAAHDGLKGLMEGMSPEGLKTFINGTNATLKRSALEALAKQQAPEAIDLLTAALQDNDSSTRIKAVEALAKIDDSRVVDSLITALKDENYRVRGKAAIALGQRKDPRTIQPLIQLINRKVTKPASTSRYSRNRKSKSRASTFEKKTAFEALINMSASLDVRTLLEMYKSFGYPYSSKVLPLLIDTKDPEATDVYIGVLKGKNTGLRRTVMGILGSRNDRRAIGPIIDCLKSRSSIEKKKAAHTLKVMTGKDFGTSYKKWKKWWKKNQ